MAGIAEVAKKSRPNRVARRAAVVLAVLFALLAVVSVAAVTFSQKIDGSSMRPTFADGDRILLEPSFDIAELTRFDVVAARPAPNTPAIVKRVIGLPGDGVRVEIREGAAVLLIRPAGSSTWNAVESSAWRGQWLDGRVCCGPDGKAGADQNAVVPDGGLFVVGDNPDQSDDSRQFGWIPADQVVGRVWVRVLPLSGLGSVDDDFRLTPAG